MHSTQPRRPPHALVVGVLAAALLGPGLAQAQAPAASGPPGRLIPATDLIGYAEFQGFDAHADAWRKSAAFKVLNETSLGVLLSHSLAQLADAAPGLARAKVSGKEILALVDHAARSGLALGISGEKGEAPRVVLVLRGAARAAIRPTVQKLIGIVFAAGDGPKEVRDGGRVRSVGMISERAWTWWDEGEDLVLATESPGHVSAIRAAIDGKAPAALTHPIRAELAATEDAFEPAALAFLDVSKLPPPPPDAAPAGLDGLKRVDLRWGFQDDALLTILRAVAPAPRKGLLALFDQPTFNAQSLPPLPPGLTFFNALSTDPGKLYDGVAAISKALDPRSAQAFDQAEAETRDRLGVGLRDDLLAHLGPKAAFYARTQATMPGLPIPMSVPKATILIQVNDPKTFAKTLDTALTTANERLKALAADRPAGAPGPRNPFAFRKAEGPGTTYTLELPPGSLPPAPFLAGLKPTMTLGQHYLVISTTPDAARKALAAEPEGAPRWTPEGDFKPMADRLPKNLLFLSVTDPRDTLPALLASLPALVQGIDAQARGAQQRANQPVVGLPFTIDPEEVPTPDAVAARLFPASFTLSVDDSAIRLVSRESLPSIANPASAGFAVGLLLPATQAAREAARRAQCVNHLKQIGLAFHNYHDVNNHLPPAAIRDKAGKPLLSWRVAILPYLEQGALYDRFHLDEPWDSPHNKTLLGSMPPMFACPSAPRPDPATTNYRAIVGPGAAFEGAEGRSFRDVTDGTSMTLAVVEAKDAIPWTKPEDLPFDPDVKAPALPSSFHSGGANVLFLDGSVRFLKNSVAPAVLRALETRAGGEVIQQGDY